MVAIEFWRLKGDLRNKLSTLNIDLMKCGRAKWQTGGGTRKDFNIVQIRQDKKFFISELFKSFNSIDPELQDNVLIPSSTFITADVQSIYTPSQIQD